MSATDTLRTPWWETTSEWINRNRWLASSVLFVATAYILSRTRGMYHPKNIYIFCLLIVWFGFDLVSYGGRVFENTPFRTPTRFLAVSAVFLSGILAVKPFLMYADPHTSAYQIMVTLLCLSTSAIIIWTKLTWSERAHRQAQRAFTLAVVLLAAARIVSLFASPAPSIDVFVKIKLAAENVLHGVNPYGATYPDIYAGKYGLFSGFPYLPGLLYWVTPFQWLTKDVRAGLLLADLLSALTLYQIARFRKVPAAVSHAVTLLWLTFPVALLVLEQSWIDTLLILGVGRLAYAILRGRWREAGIILGALAAVKQYAFIVGMFTLVGVFFSGGNPKAQLGNTVRLATWALGTCLLLLFPFFVLNPHAFIYDVFLSFGELTIRNDSFSLVTLFLNKWGIEIPRYLSLAIYAVTAGTLLAYLARHPRITVWSGCLVLMYAVLFQFGVQAFCNYYQFVAYLVLLHLTLVLSGIETPPANAAPR
jgi:hypothetical protein